MARDAPVAGRRDLNLRVRPLEVWASPEPTVARVDARTWRDQSVETGAARRGVADARRLVELGVHGARIPVLWERVAPDDPTVLDLAPARLVLETLRDGGVAPIVTLLHHGSGPRYTDLLDPAFPLLFADYAERVARAFPWITRWTPVNEPLTTARFATLYGVWYPNLRDDVAFGRAMVHQTLAQQAAMERIRSIVPGAEFVLTEDLQRFSAADGGVAAYAAFLRERTFLSLDLVAGRVDAAHPLTPFLAERAGVSAGEFAAMRAGATPPDLVAWNHYPHSERYLFTTASGATGDVPAVYVADEPSPRAGPLLHAAAMRTGLAVALGEVHVHAPEAERVRWLLQHAADVHELRALGVDVRALGAWAAFGMVDWHSLLRERRGVAEDGIFTFAPGGEPEPTAVAAAVRALARGDVPAGGGAPGWWERPERLRAPHDLLAMRERGLHEGAHVVGPGRTAALA